MLTNEQLGSVAHQLIVTANFTKRQPRHPWTQTLLDFIKGTGINYEVCEQTIGPAEILKLDDGYIKYLLSMPHQSYEGQDSDQFIWITGTDPNNDDHCITPDDACAYLLEKRFPGMSVEHGRDAVGNHTAKIKSKEQEVDIIFDKKIFED